MTEAVPGSLVGGVDTVTGRIIVLPADRLYHVWVRDSVNPSTWNVHTCGLHAVADVLSGDRVNECDCEPEYEAWCLSIIADTYDTGVGTRTNSGLVACGRPGGFRVVREGPPAVLERT